MFCLFSDYLFVVVFGAAEVVSSALIVAKNFSKSVKIFELVVSLGSEQWMLPFSKMI